MAILRASSGAFGSSSALDGLMQQHSSSAVPPAAIAAGVAAARAAAAAVAGTASPQQGLSSLRKGLPNGSDQQTAGRLPDPSGFEVCRCWPSECRCCTFMSCHNAVIDN